MLKIYKCFKPKIFPRTGSVRFFACNDCPMFECKRPINEEEEEIEKMIREIKYFRTPRLFKPQCPPDIKTHKNIFYFICIPCLIAMFVNLFFFEDHHPKRLKFVPYTFLRIRNKPYHWDPQRTLFHNPEYNALPDGYEVEFPEEDEIHPLDLKSDFHYR